MARVVNDFITTVFVAETNSELGNGSSCTIFLADKVVRVVVFLAFELARLPDLGCVEKVVDAVGGDFGEKSRLRVLIVWTLTTPDSMARSIPSISSVMDLVSRLTILLTTDFRLIVFKCPRSCKGVVYLVTESLMLWLLWLMGNG